MTADDPIGQKAPGGADGGIDRGARRVVVARVATALAALLVLAALVVPDDFAHLTPAGFLSIPVEALLGVVIARPGIRYRAGPSVRPAVGLAVVPGR